MRGVRLHRGRTSLTQLADPAGMSRIWYVAVRPDTETPDLASGLVMADTEEEARGMIGPIPHLMLFPKPEGMLWPGPKDQRLDWHRGPMDKSPEGFQEALRSHRRHHGY